MAPEGPLCHSQQPVTCPILSQISPVQETQSYLLKIHFNIIFNLHLRLQSVLFPSRFPTKTMHTSRLSPIRCYIPHPSHSSWFYQFCLLRRYISYSRKELESRKQLVLEFDVRPHSNRIKEFQWEDSNNVGEERTNRWHRYTCLFTSS